MSELVLAPPTKIERSEPDAMGLLRELSSKTDDPQVAVAIAKAVVEVTQSMERFKWEREERQSKIDFDDALNACQAKIGRIAPNAKRENNIMWADYAQLDRAVRPIFTDAGFSISFSEESADNGRLRLKAILSRGGQQREYFSSISLAAANSKMNQADAEASADSRVKRYLLLKIFDIAIGIDADEKKPFQQITERQEADLQEWIDSLRNAPDLPQLKGVFADAYKYAKPLGQGQKVTEVYEEQKRKHLQNGGAR